MNEKALLIHLVSMEAACGDTRRNLEKICAYIERAGQEGADTVVFPELSLTGYCLLHAKDAALPAAHPQVDALRQCARDAGVTALVGMAERRGEDVYVSQLVCGRDGGLRIYRKTHLGTRERAVFTAGSELPVFEAQPPFGIAICYDLHFPETASTLRARGARWIAAPHACPEKAGTRREIWGKYMPARAYDSRLYIACCNVCGSNGCGTDFSGGLAVYTPDGGVTASDFSGGEAVLPAVLPPARFAGGADFPAHRRPELYI